GDVNAAKALLGLAQAPRRLTIGVGPAVQSLEPLLEVCETSRGARVVLLCTPESLPRGTALGLGRVTRRARRLRELLCRRESGDALGEMRRCRERLAQSPVPRTGRFEDFADLASPTLQGID